MEDRALMNKYEILRTTFLTYGSVAVAFSGGVDSTFLLYTAHKVLGDKAIAITEGSKLIPGDELNESKEFCKTHGIKHIVFEPDMLSVEGFAENPTNRCYICKKTLFSQIKEMATKNGIRVVVDGSNADDAGDYRPGLQALEELKIKSPLKELGFTKKEIRILSKELGLPTWEKPSYACLASRIPYGERIDDTKLKLVEEAEKYLHGLGFLEVRVRVHNALIARIELNPNDFSRFMRGDVRLEVNQRLKQMGFAYVALDLQGYRTGSMNESAVFLSRSEATTRES